MVPAPVERSEVPGHRQRSSAAPTVGGLRRALSPTFPAGEMVFLSLGGWWPTTPARRISTCSGRLGGAAAAGRAMVMSPAARDSFSVILRFGADDGATGSTAPTALIESRVDWLYIVLSLPTFRLVRSWSLSLSAGLPKNLARRIFGGAMPARPARAGAAGAGRRW